jgi:ABC-2 type transport system ATP-binding protein
MDEADQYSDVICIIDKGKIIANGTPESLKNSLSKDFIQLQTDNDQKARELIQNLPDLTQIRTSPQGLIININPNAHPITKVIDVLRGAGVEIVGITLVKPTLDDVFIHYTGRGFSDASPEAAGEHH